MESKEIAFFRPTKFSRIAFAVYFSMAVFGCGVVQLLWVLVPCIRSGYGIKLRTPTLSPRVNTFCFLIGPGAVPWIPTPRDSQ